MPYMGYEDLEKSDRLTIREVELLAIENGYDYSITDKGIRLIAADGGKRLFKGGTKASSVGNFMGYSEGGSVKSKTGHTDLRKTGLFR